MSNKQYREYVYKIKEDYDKSLKVNGEDLAVYSKKKLDELYPQNDYVILGETYEKKKRDKEKDLGKIELNDKKLYVGENGKHSKLFKWQAAFVETTDGGFIALLKTRLILLIILLALILGSIFCGLFLTIRGIGTSPDIDQTAESTEIDPGITPVETEIITISGTVTKDQKGVEGATLSLQLGNKEIATATTDKDGKYLISDVENGNYNLVCTYGESVLTKSAIVNNVSIIVNFVFPADDLHDVEEITGHHDKEDLPDVEPTDENTDVKALVKITDENTPPIAVGGLSEEAMLHMIVGKEVDITFLATLLTDDKVPAVDKAAIEAISGELELKYYDFSVLKEIFKDKVLESSEYLKNTKTVLEVAVPHDSMKAVGTYAFRYHDGAALRMEELSQRPESDYKDGTFYVTADTVYVYTNCFSTYAIGSAYTDRIVRGKDTISYSDKAIVNLQTKQISMLYEHDNDSTNEAKVEILIVGSNGNLLIAESEPIPVGYKIETMKLKSGIENMPSVGTYNGLMRITYLGGEGAQTDTKVEIPLSVAITQ